MPIIFSIFLLSMLAGCSSTNNWDEEVRVNNESIVIVNRKTRILRTPKDPESSVVREQWFTYLPMGVYWYTRDDYEIPVSFDIIDSEPYLVTLGYHVCLTEDNQIQGVHVYTWKSKELVELPIDQELINKLKYNLHRAYKGANPNDDTHGYHTLIMKQYGWRDYSVSAPDLEQGRPLFDWLAENEAKTNKCLVKPDNSPATLERLKRTAEIARNTPTIPATVLSVVTEPEVIPYDQRGYWVDHMYTNKSCEGIVERVTPIPDPGPKRFNKVGLEIRLNIENVGKKNIQIGTVNSFIGGSEMCDQSTIFIVGRENKENLIIYRLTRSGELIDVYRVSLPDVSMVSPGSDWGQVGNFTSDGKGNISFSLVDCKDLKDGSLGRIINNRINYVSNMPVR